MERKPLVIISGPTAAGKTKISLSLAKALSAEIICADCVQVYKKVDIGSAKIKKEEMEGVPHHLVDVLEPEEDFHVVKFCAMAKKALRQIYEKGKIPIVTGGSGFYIHALLYDADFDKEGPDQGYRAALTVLAEEKGAATLHEMLKKADPKAAEAIHHNDVKRVVRALEFYRQTGKKISEHNARERAKNSPYNAAYFVLNLERRELYRRIERRVDSMMERGFIQEVKALKERGLSPKNLSMQGIGYKEIFSYLEGEMTLEESVDRIKEDTRHYAKRQLSWFKNEKNVILVNQQDFSYNEEKILGYMVGVLKEKGIIE